MKKILIVCFALISAGFGLNAQDVKTMTDDGAWCWFSGPRAIYLHNQSDAILTGWVDSVGSIKAALLNPETHQVQVQTVASKLDQDDHSNPAFAQLNDKQVLMTYTMHFDEVVRASKLTVDGDSLTFQTPVEYTVFDQEQYDLYPQKGVGYANPFTLSEDNGRVYVFGRWTGYKPNMMWSDDNGETFTKGKVLITNKPFNGRNRPYVRYYSDGKSKIHILFTDGHPRNEPLNSVYYAYYEKGAFWRADHSKICDVENMPFEPNEASIVYQATEENGRAWVYDLAVDKKGNPVVLYARYPDEETHLYHYAAFDGKQWNDTKLCHSGKWFPQTPEGETEPEPHYSAGMSFHPLKPEIVYLSREVNGVFEIEKWQSRKKGQQWKVTPLTQNSEFDNVRPIVPKNMVKGDKPVVLWMVNEKYVHYRDYKTRIDYCIDK